jgi:acyl carrier protein
MSIGNHDRDTRELSGEAVAESIGARVIRVITDTQKLPEGKITADSTFEELGFDSLDGINILFALENEFDINIPDDAARSIKSIPEMVKGIEGLVEAKVLAAKTLATKGTA